MLRMPRPGTVAAGDGVGEDVAGHHGARQLFTPETDLHKLYGADPHHRQPAGMVWLMPEALDTFDLPTAAREFLESHQTATVATVDPDGRPHAANVQYVSDRAMNLYFISAPNSAHSQHIRQLATAAVTVYDHDDRPDRIRGVQIHSQGHLLDKLNAHPHVLELYLSKFPFAASADFQKLIAAQHFFKLTPHWLRLIDNTRSFGFKAEQHLPAQND